MTFLKRFLLLGVLLPALPIGCQDVKTPKQVTEGEPSRAPASVGKWKERATLNGHKQPMTSLAFRPDGKKLASCDWNFKGKGIIKVWDVVTGQEQLSWDADLDGFHGVCFSPTGKLLASAATRRVAPLWEAETGQEVALLGSHTGGVFSVAFSPDGASLVTAGGDDKTGEVRCWNSETGKNRWTIDSRRGAVRCIAFSPDGRILVTGEGMNQEGKIVVRDAATGSEQATWGAHEKDVFSLAFSSDGKTLASCGKDRKAKLWDIASGSQRTIAKQESGWIRSLAFSPDGRLLALACGSYNSITNRATGEVRLWDVEAEDEGEPLRNRKGFLTFVAFSPDGKTLAVAGEDQAIVLWDRITH